MGLGGSEQQWDAGWRTSSLDELRRMAFSLAFLHLFSSFTLYLFLGFILNLVYFIQLLLRMLFLKV